METCDELIKRPKRKFSEAWLSDDRFNSWIRKVSFDDTLFHCIACNKNFACFSSSHVLRHADSACHKKNIKEGILFNNDDIISKAKARKPVFRQQWLDIQEFKPWLREVSEDENLVFCVICDKSFTAGLSKIYRHAESKVHLSKCNEINLEMSEPNNDLKAQINESLLLFEERKKSAEIRYAALIAEKNISHQTAEAILNFFQHVGKDANVLKSMNMGRTKCRNIISNVLCPVETDRIVNNIQNTKFSIFIDETTDISNEKWMTFIVRYVDPQTLDIRSQLVKLINIGAKNCGSETLFDAFKSEMSKLQIPFLNIIALSCDNVSAMTGKYLLFKKKLEEICENLLTFSCPCYSTALIAHAACIKIPDFCEEFIKKIANYINNNTKLQLLCSTVFHKFSEYFQERNRKILKLSDMRWLSHLSYIEMLIESWDAIKNFLNEVATSERTKCEEYLLSIMQNPDTKAYLLFLKYILHFFNKYNTFFQAMETRIHLLQSKSVDFLIQVSKNFLKPKVLKNLPNNINFAETENHKSMNNLNLGSECEEYLRQLINEGYPNIVTTIRQNCLLFYVTAAEEIHKRLPINNIFLSKLKVFLPNTALFDIHRETSFDDISFIAETLGGFDEDNLRKEWLSLHLDFTIAEKQNLSKLNFDEMWKKILQYQYSTEIVKYPNLKFLLDAIRALPNSNANTEKMFPFLTDLKTKRRNKLSADSVNAICVFKSALKTRRETVLNMKIDAKHLSLMSSDKLYPSSAKKQKSFLISHIADNDVADNDVADDNDNDIVGPSSSTCDISNI